MLLPEGAQRALGRGYHSQDAAAQCLIKATNHDHLQISAACKATKRKALTCHALAGGRQCQRTQCCHLREISSHWEGATRARMLQHSRWITRDPLSPWAHPTRLPGTSCICVDINASYHSHLRVSNQLRGYRSQYVSAAVSKHLKEVNLRDRRRAACCSASAVAVRLHASAGALLTAVRAVCCCCCLSICLCLWLCPVEMSD